MFLVDKARHSLKDKMGDEERGVELVESKEFWTVEMAKALPHSAKPEGIQDSLEKMYAGPYLEMFARRDRAGWYCVGNEAPDTMGEDIARSLMRLDGRAP